jgi:hypothetical protein
MRNVLMMTAMLFVAGCATDDATSAIEPEITITQLSRVAEGTQYDTGPVSAHFAVEVRNPTTEPFHLDRVDVQSLGGGAYDLPPHSQAFDITIAPKESRSIDFWAPANVSNPTVSGANGPLTIRAMLQFDAAGKKFQKVVVQNISAVGGN